ncbi:MAG TPA: hypothetical protein VG095_05610 [Chthoniobacterales bacterium]|nr:hypothetical protein [Chthoniobacterales bacterium]
MLRGVVLLFLFVSLAHAQEQERKLLDRLLRPDMSLQNNAQTKQFTAAGATVTKKAPTKFFFFRKRKAEPAFWDTRQVKMKEVEPRPARLGKTQATLRTRTEIRNVDTAYPAPGYRAVRMSRDAGRTVETSQFADSSRPFLGKGTRQQALSRQDRPMTIDEVRELLNKNN